METLKKRLENAGALAGQTLHGASNAPAEYRKLRSFGYAEATGAFYARTAKYASDVYRARVQGLDPDDFFTWCVRQIRVADVIDPSASLLGRMDNIKNIMFIDDAISYLPRGAKIEAAGNTWLVTNPQNISTGGATAIVERCRAVWNYLDWYGNVCSEPLVIDDNMLRANAIDPQEITLVTKGYVNVKCQYNEATRQLDTNSRMILGRGAYHVTGFSDFLREFTDRDDSVHMLEFTLRYEAPIGEMDDMQRHVAGGKLFRWELELSASGSMNIGRQQVLAVRSVRNGEVVNGSFEHPVYYNFMSSDDSVATVDSGGTVTAVAEGRCEITVWLEQNPQVQRVLPIEVAGERADGVEFLSPVPEVLRAYSCVTLEAAYVENGEPGSGTVGWEYGGAAPGSYSCREEGNRLTVSGWAASAAPLTITARCEGHSATASIKLRGI